VTPGSVHVVVPPGIDDPARPSGGNTYDRRICLGLADLGWSVCEHAVPGPWPRPDAVARAALAGRIAAIPDGAVTLVDGLIASTVPEVLVPEAGRLRLVVLAHMPLGDAWPDDEVAGVQTREGAVLSAAAAVVTPSGWSRRWLLDAYDLPPAQVRVAEPGVDAADAATGTASGGALLCVAAVTPNKGHDLLLESLATLTDLAWHVDCVGSLELDPGFVDRLHRQARTSGIGDRVCFTGARSGADLDAAYAAADLLVLASWAETYGMVVTEALARGVPVVASDVGGVPEALGQASDGSRPGLLVPRGDRTAFAAALRRWLADAGLRQRLREAAGQRRRTLPRWSDTSAGLSRVLAEVVANDR
jgi:glycosyltransferase involved in cell wall biosynthesis